MLDELGLSSSELSVLLCDDDTIHRINLEHRGKDKPTDVLAFPQAQFRAPGRVKAGYDLALLGDVIISIDTAERQAATRKRALIEEIRFLLAHGVLHLFGYDHATKAEKIVMTKQTRHLVKCAPLLRLPR